MQHPVGRALDALRALIEQFINQVKNSRRVANQYDYTASSSLGFVMLAAIRQLIRFIHAT